MVGNNSAAIKTTVLFVGEFWAFKSDKGERVDFSLKFLHCHPNSHSSATSKLDNDNESAVIKSCRPFKESDRRIEIMVQESIVGVLCVRASEVITNRPRIFIIKICFPNVVSAYLIRAEKQI